MVLLPAGLLLGKAVMDNVARRGQPAVRVSRTLASTSISNYGNPRRRVLQKVANSSNPFTKDEVLHRIGGRGIRTSAHQLQREQEQLKEALRDEKWVAVYRYPPIRFGVLLARAKLVQTIASVMYLPYSGYQYSLGAVDSSWFYSTAALAVAAPLLLAIFSRYLNRLVGVIAMNESNDHVRVGYLSFWGSRRNAFIELTDVLPLTEANVNRSDSLVKFSWYGANGDFLFLPIDKAEIMDEERAELLFGDLSIFHTKKDLKEPTEKKND